MNEKIAIDLIRVTINEYRKVDSTIESGHQALIRIKNIVDALNKEAAPLQRVEGPGVSTRTA